MARSLYRDTVCFRGPAGLIPLGGASVRFYEPGGVTPPTTPIAYPLYADATTTTPIPIPFSTGALGELEIWSDLPHRVRILVNKPGLASADEIIDLSLDPAESATDPEVAAAIADHEAKADPHTQYLTAARGDDLFLTPAEGNLLYLPIGYVPPPTDLSNYYTKVQADSRFIDTAGDAMTGTLGLISATVSTGIVFGGDTGLARRFPGVLAVNDEPLLTAITADVRYQQSSQKGQPSGYVPLDAGSLIPPQYLPPLAITETFVVASQAAMLALPAQRGDVAIRTDLTKTYILAADPATTLANWVEMVSSSLAGNVTVVQREEFAPAASATTVSLTAAPTEVLSVSRNGVVQSALAGHYTLAGSVLTFSTAFAASEQVGVVYEVGVSVPVDAYSKSEADTRFVNATGDGVTGPITGLWNAPVGTAPKITVNATAPSSPVTGDVWIW